TRAGVRPGSARSAASASSRRSSSTATASRSPRSTPAWTCVGTTELRRPPSVRLLRRVAFALALAPALWLAARFALEGAGPNPIETLTHATGAWAMRLLLASLAVTPLRRLLGWSWLAPLRRSFGLAAFAWAAAHGTVWAALDLGLDPAAL